MIEYVRGAAGDEPPDDFDWAVRTHLYASFGRNGEAPSIDDLAALNGAPPARVRASLLKLQKARQVVLGSSGDVWMAHPFSAVPTDFPVETPDVSCYANCAWDALGVPAALGTDGWTQTACPFSGEPLEFGVRKRKPEGDAGIAFHLLTPVREAWDDIGFT